MAQPAGTFSSYDAVGNREDLSDVIDDISPVETPVVSMFNSGSATNRTHEWQVDELADAADDNATVEGDDFPESDSAPTERLNNATQILTKDVTTSHTQEAIDSAGRASEIDYQVAKRLLELRRDLEASVTANQAKVVGNDTTARRMAGLGAWLRNNTDFGAGGANPPDTNNGWADGNTARTDGTQRPFLESQMQNVLQLQWDEGGMCDVATMGGFNKQVFSSFSGNNTRFSNSEDARLVATVEVYRSDFSTFRVVPNRFQRARDAFFLQSDKGTISDLIPTNTFEVAKTGLTHKRMIERETTLKMNNAKAHGAVYDLTTS